MVRTSEVHGYVCGLGIVSNAPDVPGMCVVCGIKRTWWNVYVFGSRRSRR